MFGPEPPPRPIQGEPSEEPPPCAESGLLIGRCDLERDLELLLTQALREAEGSDSLVLVEECTQLREECQQLMSRSLATSRSLQVSEHRVAELQTQHESDVRTNARNVDDESSQLRAANQLVGNLNSQLEMNREARVAADLSHAAAEQTIRRNLSNEFETALADRCRRMLQHHEAAVSQLQGELGVQCIRTESEKGYCLVSGTSP